MRVSAGAVLGRSQEILCSLSFRKPADHFYSMCRQTWVCKMSKTEEFIECLPLSAMGCARCTCRVVKLQLSLSQSTPTISGDITIEKNHTECVDFHLLVFKFYYVTRPNLLGIEDIFQSTTENKYNLLLKIECADSEH